MPKFAGSAEARNRKVPPFFAFGFAGGTARTGTGRTLVSPVVAVAPAGAVDAGLVAVATVVAVAAAVVAVGCVTVVAVASAAGPHATVSSAVRPVSPTKERSICFLFVTRLLTFFPIFLEPAG
jgi:hypothetical protein